MGSLSFELDFEPEVSVGGVVEPEERLRVYDRQTIPSSPLDCFNIVVVIIIFKQLATHTDLSSLSQSNITTCSKFSSAFQNVIGSDFFNFLF